MDHRNLSFTAANGKLYTKQLFWEQWVNDPIEDRLFDDPPFTLHKDKPGKINFGKEYVRLADPTGTKITDLLLKGNYNHWLALLNARWFSSAKEVWDRELDARLKADAMAKIIELTGEDNPPAQRLAAAKYLAGAEYRKEIASKGRPSKDAINREAARMAEDDRSLAEDLKRIRNNTHG